MPQIMRTFDYDMVQILHKELYDHGVELIVGDKVESFATNQILLNSGRVKTSRNRHNGNRCCTETNPATAAQLDLGQNWSNRS